MKANGILLFCILLLPNMLSAQERSIGFNGLNLIRGNDASISFRNWKDTMHNFRTDLVLMYGNRMTMVKDDLPGLSSDDKKDGYLSANVGLLFSKESLKTINHNWSYFLNPVYGINSSYYANQYLTKHSESLLYIGKDEKLGIGLSGGLRLGLFRKLGEKFSLSVESQVTLAAGYTQTNTQTGGYGIDPVSGSYSQTNNVVKTNKSGFYTSLNNQYLLSAVLSFHYPKKH